jgi:hypothetical protein
MLASKYDKLDKNFLYAVAGSASDDECGKCYQVKLLDAERQIQGMTKRGSILGKIEKIFSEEWRNEEEVLRGELYDN